MLYVENDGAIRLTRGDSAFIEVKISNSLNGEVYNLSPEETLTMTVRKRPRSKDIVFQKVSVGSNSFTIEPEDTAGWRFGLYRYDVQLTTSSGQIYTVIEPTIFEIMAEVTYR